MPQVLTDRQERILIELRELSDLDPTTKMSFTEVLGASGIKVTSPAMTRAWVATSPEHRGLAVADLEDFEGAGLLAVDWGRAENGRRGDFRFTQNGAAYVHRIMAPAPPTLPPPIGLDWDSDVLPVLRVIYSLEQVLPANARGVSRDDINHQLQRAEGNPSTDRVLNRLSSGGYLTDELTVHQIEAPLYCRLSEKGLQQVANWPGAPQADLSARFFDLLNARIADPETTDEERGRLKRLRETASEVGQSVFTSLLTAFIKGQTDM